MPDFIPRRITRVLMKTDNFSLNDLNSEQQKAVTNTLGPMIVLAGAGSGKTRVLVSKVLYLVLEKNVNPLNILMVTFTNKAAGEMMDRIKLVFAQHKITTLPTVGTFHYLCSKILRRDGNHIGIPVNYLIFDSHDQLETIKEAFNLLSISLKEVRPKAVLQTISQAKNQMIDQYTYPSFAHGYFQEIVSRIYPVYQNLLREHNAVDFDDLLLQTIKLLKDNPEILQKYQDMYHYVLVDEYQDTNQAQYILTKMLGGKTRNICVVGDFAQSIYSFRGADFRNLEKFKKDFPETATFPLSQNYRSTQKILDAAYSVVSKNTTHPILSLWTKNKEGEEIIIHQANNEHGEAEFIIEKIREQQSRNPNFSMSDVAVLYRMNAQSRALEEAFLHNGTPYVLVGGTRFYERREIKDVLSYLSFLSNQKNSVAHKRIAKLGKKRLALFEEYVEEFNEKEKINNDTIEILDEVLKKTTYLSLYDETDPEDKPRLENIKELRSVAIEFPSLVQFLENVSLVEQEYLPDKPKNGEKVNAVTFMTLHAAKGLEFKMVFLVGMEEGLFPHSQSFFDISELEEERRLCYVGITRAKEKLFLCFTRKRLFFGQSVQNSISRFIYELPEYVLKNNYIERYTDEPDYL